MSTYTLAEAKAQLSRLISLVEAGEEVTFYQTWARRCKDCAERTCSRTNAQSRRTSRPNHTADGVGRRVHASAAGIRPVLMRYLDTSVLLAFLLPKPGSSSAEALMTSKGDALVVSSWTEVELMSALGVKIRSRQIAEREALSAMSACTRLVLPCLRKVPVSDSDHHQAVELLKGWRTALRAGDGLHLAIAEAHQATIFTFDQGLAKAGATLGVVVRLLTC